MAVNMREVRTGKLYTFLVVLQMKTVAAFLTPLPDNKDWDVLIFVMPVDEVKKKTSIKNKKCSEVA